MSSSKNNHDESPPPAEPAEPTVNQFGETLAFGAGDTSGFEATADLSIPAAIGRYEIRSLIARGNFGAVFRGYDSQLARQVAIKVPRLGTQRETQEQFLAEARRLAQLNHANIVGVHDVGVEDGQCYLVSEFLEGPDLNHWVRKQQPTWEESVRIVASLADALAAAHSRNTIHRDIKPANVIIVERPEGAVPVLVDFGLALSEDSRSQRGQVAGTPNYMSPEQARGEGHRIDGRTDIYSLGVVLYRMLCGRLPFSAPSLSELLEQVMMDEPQPPRQFATNLPRELERVCLKAMSKQLVDRYTTASDFAEELRVLAPATAAAPAPAEPPRVAAKPRPREAMKILIADDHELSRFKLQTDLEKWGHEVTAAADGAEAWELFQSHEFSIVITDWMMPNVDGLELVRRIRANNDSDYVYIIMLTAKAEKQDIVAGIGTGADDFLAKPVHRDELQVRLRAGARITRLNRELNETNRRMLRSVEAAAQIQQSFLPQLAPQLEGFQFAWSHRGGVQLGGDMFNVVQLDADRAGAFMLDVSGESVPAALLATTLMRAMSHGADSASLLVDRGDGGPQVPPPADVLQRLNRRFAPMLEPKQFFTVAYGVLDRRTREFRFSLAGHTPVLHQRASASPAMLDIDSYPIGLAPPEEEFGERSIALEPGDRLLMYSDGLTDTMNEEGEVFGAARMLESIAQQRPVALEEVVHTLTAQARKWRGEMESKDDISVLAIEALG